MTKIANYEPKFEIAATQLDLEVWTDFGSARPAPSFVVARRHDGTVASVYGDLNWDFNSYIHDGCNGILDFSFWHKGELDHKHHELIEEVKWLDFCHIWKRDGKSIAISTLKLLHLSQCRVARFAYDNEISIIQLISCEPEFLKYAETLTPFEAVQLRHVIFSLSRIDSVELGFKLVGKKAYESLSKMASKISYHQTAPLPTRLYGKLISRLTDQLTEVEVVIDEILRLVSECDRDPMMGRSYAQQRGRGKVKTGTIYSKSDERPDFDALAAIHNLHDYFDRHEVRNVRSLSRHLSQIQTLCKLIIHVYSGMRDNEVETLPFQCLTQQKRGGLLHYLIEGSTYKFVGQHGKRTKWITGEDGARAIRVAQKLAISIFTMSNRDGALPDKPDDSYPLFVTAAHIRLGTPDLPHLGGGFKRAVSLHLKSHREWIRSLDLVITEQDVQELRNMNPYRNWGEEKYQIGRHWPLTTHQLRRSLALYASRSGLVSLPSLRRQLQHVTQAMSLYYARGSHFAANFLGQDDKENRRHFLYEYQDTQPESEMLAFLVHVVTTTEPLQGGQGTYWHRQKLKGNIDIITFDRARTMKEIKNGLRSYKDTPLGGCGKVGECNERAMGNVLGCLLAEGSTKDSGPKPCKDSYISLQALESVIEVQNALVSKEKALDATSMYYKEAIDDLDVLTAYRAKHVKIYAHEKG